ncbi:MAG: flagellar hook assembly protein FlgD [Asticcacaulis sp.]
MSYTISPTASVVDTSASSTASTSTSGLTKDAASITGNYSTFLNLLTAQIKNQDPLSPMDTTQWTNQLVQYSSVEQQLKSNQYLSQIAAGAGADMSSAVNFIGKTVSADTKTATLNNGAATWDYNLGGTASKLTLTVKDKNGDVVWSGAGDTAKGTHSFKWDGKTASGTQLNSGDYTLSLNATDASGNAIDSTIGVSGVVTSAETSNGAVMLTVGGTQVALSDITGVAATASN